MQQHILSGTVPKLDHVLQISNNIVTLQLQIVPFVPSCQMHSRYTASGNWNYVSHAGPFPTLQQMSEQDLF